MFRVQTLALCVSPRFSIDFCGVHFTRVQMKKENGLRRVTRCRELARIETLIKMGAYLFIRHERVEENHFSSTFCVNQLVQMVVDHWLSLWQMIIWLVGFHEVWIKKRLILVTHINIRCWSSAYTCIRILCSAHNSTFLKINIRKEELHIAKKKRAQRVKVIKEQRC